MLWTHNLKSIIYNDSFVPDGAPSTETYQGIQQRREMAFRRVTERPLQQSRWVQVCNGTRRMTQWRSKDDSWSAGYLQEPRSVLLAVG